MGNTDKTNLKKEFIEINKKIEKDPDNPKYYYEIGSLYELEKKTHKSLEYYKKAKKMSPNNVDYLYRCGAAYYRDSFDNPLSLDDHEDMYQCFKKAIELNPADASSYHFLGILSEVMDGDFNKAWEYYDKALKLKPYKTIFLEDLLVIIEEFACYDNGWLDDIIEYYTRLIKNHPDKSNYYFKRGNYYWDFKLVNNNEEYFKNAINDFSKAIELKPDNIKYYFQRAKLYSILDKYELAYKDYDKIISIDSECISAYIEKTNLLTKFKDYKKALEFSDLIINLFPENYQSYENRANVYKGLYKYIKSVDDLNSAIKLSPNNASLYYSKFYSLFSHIIFNKKALKSSQELEAIKSINKANELNPDNFAYSKKNYRFFDLLKHFKKVKTLLGTYNLWIEQDPNYYYSYLKRAQIYKCQGDFDSALNDIKKAIELNPNSLRCNFEYILLLMKKNKGTIRQIQKIISKIQKEGEKRDFGLEIKSPVDGDFDLKYLLWYCPLNLFIDIFSELFQQEFTYKNIDNIKKLIDDILNDKVKDYQNKKDLEIIESIFKEYPNINDFFKNDYLNIIYKIEDIKKRDRGKFPNNLKKSIIKYFYSKLDKSINEIIQNVENYEHDEIFDNNYIDEIISIKEVNLRKEKLNSLQNYLLEQEYIENQKIEKQKEHQIAQARIEAEEKAHKEMLSFLTHTLNNALGTGDNTIQKVISDLSNTENKQNQQNIYRLNSLFANFSLIRNLLKTYKIYIQEPAFFQERWQKDSSGEANLVWVLVYSLRQITSQLLYVSDPKVFNRLQKSTKKYGNKEELKKANKKIRESFVNDLLVKDINRENVPDLFKWFTLNLPFIKINLNAPLLNFEQENIRFGLFFACFSELIGNALKYSDGKNPIEICWEEDKEYYSFKVKNSYDKEIYKDVKALGSQKGINFIRRIMDLFDGDKKQQENLLEKNLSDFENLKGLSEKSTKEFVQIGADNEKFAVVINFPKKKFK